MSTLFCLPRHAGRRDVATVLGKAAAEHGRTTRWRHAVMPSGTRETDAFHDVARSNTGRTWLVPARHLIHTRF